MDDRAEMSYLVTMDEARYKAATRKTVYTSLEDESEEGRQWLLRNSPWRKLLKARMEQIRAR